MVASVALSVFGLAGFAFRPIPSEPGRGLGGLIVRVGICFVVHFSLISMNPGLWAGEEGAA